MRREKLLFITEFVRDNFGVKLDEVTGLSCLSEEQQDELGEVLRKKYGVSVTGGHIRDCIKSFGEMRALELAAFVQDRCPISPH